MKSIPYDLTTTGHVRPRFIPGTVFGPDSSGNKYMYVKVEGSPSANNIAFIQQAARSYGNVTVTPSYNASTAPYPAGVFLSSVTNGRYAYIKIAGTATLTAGSACTLGNVVSLSSVAGQVANQTAGSPVIGMALSGASAGSTVTVALDIEPKLITQAEG